MLLYQNRANRHVELKTADRFVPGDRQGLVYLNSLGIGGPITNAKIMSGDLTIEEALANKLVSINNLREEFEKRGMGKRFDQFLNDPDFKGVMKYLIDGSLQIDTLLRFRSDNDLKFLDEIIAQKYLDNGKLSMDRICNMTHNEKIGLYLLSDYEKNRVDSGHWDIEKAIETSCESFNKLPYDIQKELLSRH